MPAINCRNRVAHLSEAVEEMGEGEHFADRHRQVFTLWINNLASPDFIAAFTSACCVQSEGGLERSVNHCLVIFDSLLPDTTVMHDVKASRESSRTKNALKLPEKEVAWKGGGRLPCKWRTMPTRGE